MYLPLVNLRDFGLSADLLRLFMGAFRYVEHSQLQIAKALPPVAEEISSAALAATASASSSVPAVSDKEWKTLLGKLVSCLFYAFSFCIEVSQTRGHQKHVGTDTLYRFPAALGWYSILSTGIEAVQADDDDDNADADADNDNVADDRRLFEHQDACASYRL